MTFVGNADYASAPLSTKCSGGILLSPIVIAVKLINETLLFVITYRCQIKQHKYIFATTFRRG